MTSPTPDATEAEFIRQLQLQPPMRSLTYMNDIDGERMLNIMHQTAKNLYPLLHAIGNKDLQASGRANRYLNGVFLELKGVIDTLEDHRIDGLRDEYHRVLLHNNGARYHALVAAFPELVTRRRFYKAEDFPADQITSDHLAYMILGGCIGRIVPVFRKVTGIKEVIIYDPDNTIVSKAQRAV
jgi:hypothetical protein